MEKVDENRIEMYVEPYANHDVFFTGNVTGFAKEAESAVKIAQKFLLSHGCEC